MIVVNTPSQWSNWHGFFSTFGELDFNSRMTFTVPFRTISPAGSECVIVLPGQYGPLCTSILNDERLSLVSIFIVHSRINIISLFLIFFQFFFLIQFPHLSNLGGIARILFVCPTLECDLLKSWICLSCIFPSSLTSLSSPSNSKRDKRSL